MTRLYLLILFSIIISITGTALAAPNIQPGPDLLVDNGHSSIKGIEPGLRTDTLPPKLADISYDDKPHSQDTVSYAPNRVIVRFKAGGKNFAGLSDTITKAHALVGASVVEDFTSAGIPGMQLVKVSRSIEEVIQEYKKNPAVLYAEPDYLISISPDNNLHNISSNGMSRSLIPNDELFSSLWAMQNTGQNGGTPGADIDAIKAWDISTGSSTPIVAVIDTGVDYSHQDLASNIWTNSEEIPNNGIDDDKNGYIDDYYGWDFVNRDNDPRDDHSHGTHCAGTIAAMGNNSIGVVGVNWQSRIMALKAFSANGQGNTSDAIDAILYADKKGADIISNSWAMNEYSQALKDAIDSTSAILVCAAGNYGKDCDVTPYYPASFNSSNIISVAWSDPTDSLSQLSDYGKVTVDLAAPGSSILSTTPNNGYGYKSGTSMATPHVSGVAALLKAKDPTLTTPKIINKILSSVDLVPSLSDKLKTGGRLNAYNALATLKPLPIVKVISPGQVEKGKTVTFSVSGNNFIPGCIVTLSGPRFNSQKQTLALGGVVVNSAGTFLKGSTFLPTSLIDGYYQILVSQSSGISTAQVYTKIKSAASSPQIRHISPTQTKRGKTVKFNASGSNFSPGCVVTLTGPRNSDQQETIILEGVVVNLAGTYLQGTAFLKATLVDGYYRWQVSQSTGNSSEQIFSKLL